MATIDKLLIRGIRSFSPDSPNVIELYTPLTLILGANGCGKTTIIECLKYATTGTMPPNSKGGAFVNDPKITGEVETKAQVKLKFRNINGKVMVCTRSLQLTQNRKTVSLKTIESVLETNDEKGNRVSISTKCAELDTEIPIHLGVSKAVLENVIFVHQEESNWPLAEPKVLKDKFDDIFASTRWTKAVEELRSQRKARDSQLTADRVHLERYTERRNRSLQLTATRATLAQKIATHGNRIEALDTEITDITERLQGLLVFVAEGQNMHDRLGNLNERRKGYQEQMQELRKQIFLFKDGETTDEDLQAALADYVRKLEEEKQNEANLKGRLAELARQDGFVSSELSGKHGQLGRIHNQVERQQQLQEERQALSESLAAHVNMPIVPHVNDGLTVFTKALQDREAHLESLRKDQSDARARLQGAVAELRAKGAAFQTRKDEAREQMTHNQQLLQQKRVQLEEASRAQSDLATAQARAQELSRQLTEKQEELRTALSENRSAALRHQLDNIEGKSRTLNEELGQISRDSELRARLEARAADLAVKEGALDRAWEAIIKVSTDNNRTPPNRDLETPIQVQTMTNSTLNTKRAHRTSLEEKLAVLMREKHSLETRSQMMKSEKTQLESEVREVTRNLAMYTSVGTGGAHSLDTLITRTQEEIQACREEQSLGESFQKVFELLVEKTALSGSCALCCKKVADEQEFEEIRAYCMAEVASMPGRIEDAQRALEAAQRQLRHLEQGKPLQAQQAQLNARLSSFDDPVKGIAAVDNQLQQISDSVIATQTELEATKRDIAALEVVLARANDLLRVHQEREALKRDTDMMRSEASFSQTNKSLEQVQQELAALANQRTALNKEYDDEVNKMALLRTDVSRLQQSVNNNQQLFSEKQGLLAQYDIIKTGVADLDASIAADRERIAGLDRDLMNLSRQRDATERTLSQAISEIDQAIDQVSAEVTDLRSRVQSLKSVYEQLTQLERLNLVSTRDRIESEIAALDTQKGEIARGIEEINERLSALHDATRQLDLHHRNVQDNIKYRNLDRQVAEVTASMTELQQKIREHQQQSYSAEVHRLRAKQGEMLAESHTLQGERAAWEQRVHEMDEELQGELANAQKDYVEWRVKVKVNEMIVQDLETYAKAVDTAIMKFHEMKMEELNQIIRELWVNTYRGTDIDTIEVRADKESKGKSNYTYRVVMIKGDTELEMRGRCSAGQKVLASIIIRLALAECFCISCGVFTLDEPTTNLDRENVMALAESLAKILEHRRKQVNFQLVVITHDEEFLQILGHDKDVEYYWNVRKNENQNSIIERVPINSR